jgi:hypothetical protein
LQVTSAEEDVTDASVSTDGRLFTLVHTYRTKGYFCPTIAISTIGKPVSTTFAGTDRAFSEILGEQV